MTQVTDRVVYVTANGINKSLKQAIIDGNLSGGGGGGTSVIEVFNSMILNSSGATAMTGILYFKAPQAMTITSVVLQIYEKNGIATGSLTVDVKKNSTPNNTGMTSIFTVLPTTNFATNADYATNSGTLNGTVTLASGDWLRLDVTSIPSTLSKFQILVYGQ
jgi:hypothetical protein